MQIRTIRKGLEAFEFKFEAFHIRSIEMRFESIQMQILTIRKVFEAFECKFEPFERDLKHSNANSKHSKRDSNAFEIQIRTIRKGLEAFELKFEPFEMDSKH